MKIPVQVVQPPEAVQQPGEKSGGCVVSRRKFLLYSGAATAAIIVPITLFPGTSHALEQTGRVVGYPRKFIANLADVKDNQPLGFNYPDELANSQCMLVKLGGVRAGGGIGRQQDLVAFSYLCTHQGGPLQGTYQVTGEHRTLGQCPFHLSLFDLRRHGIIVSGQAYESLPQVLLELEQDKIYAVGMFGLIFGRSSNLMES